MRILFLLAFNFIAMFLLADGVDRVTIYVNSKAITSTYDLPDSHLKLKVKEGDTVKFVVFTDWGGHQDSDIEVYDSLGSQITILKKIRDPKYEATFFYIVSSKMLNQQQSFILNFHNAKVSPWKFMFIRFSG